MNKFWAQGPPLGSILRWVPPDQNPRSAPGRDSVSNEVRELICKTDWGTTPCRQGRSTLCPYHAVTRSFHAASPTPFNCYRLSHLCSRSPQPGFLFPFELDTGYEDLTFVAKMVWETDWFTKLFFLFVEVCSVSGSCGRCANGGKLLLPNNIFGHCRCLCSGPFAGPKCQFSVKSKRLGDEVNQGSDYRSYQGI